MRARLLVAGTFMAIAASLAVAAPGGPPPGGPGGPGMGGPPGGRMGRGGGVPANLGSAMRDMGATLKKLKAEVADTTKVDAALQDLSQFERDVAIAKMGTPDKVAAMTGDEKTKAMKEYRGLLLKVLTKVVAAEQAVQDGKPDDATAALASLDALEKQGHGEFMTQQ